MALALPVFAADEWLMVSIPLITGTGATERADLQQVLPINLEAVPLETGISKGYLRSAAGARTLTSGPGLDRGGILWSGVHYRVMGPSLVRIDGTTVTVIGDIGGTGPVTLDYGFGRLAIRSDATLWYYDGTTLAQVTDSDLGQCLDIVWMDGYYISTDGTSIVTSQLSDPTAFNPEKYGSAEADPDMVTGLLRLRDELYVLGQNTIEVFTDQGGSGFPFQVSGGATIPVGCVGPLAKVRFSQTFAFVGSGRNAALGVWLAGSGNAQKLSTRAVDDMLAAEPNPEKIQLEARVMRDEQKLLVHLSDRTLVCLNTASQKAGEVLWYVARSGLAMDKPYRLRNAIYVNGQWIVGDTESGQLGVLDDAVAEHFGEAVGWRFQSDLIWNKGNGAIIHSLELVGLPGRGKAAGAFFSTSTDGETWSVEKPMQLGRGGERDKRMAIRPHRRFANYLTMRFRGDSSALAGFAALEAAIEPLAS